MIRNNLGTFTVVSRMLYGHLKGGKYSLIISGLEREAMSARRTNGNTEQHFRMLDGLMWVKPKGLDLLYKMWKKVKQQQRFQHTKEISRKYFQIFLV